ncbi:MAG: GatB/YqeY domain-containing protein, partial [Actinobacteria bacterium]|nr:GatB/YqeY domain-containing protein [Actinomycetota bacterium]
MSLKTKIQEDMKAALKSGDKKRLKVLRFLLAQVKNAEIDKGSELSDEELLKLISKEIKKIEEAAETFREGGSEQRALEELEEAEILK